MEDVKQWYKSKTIWAALVAAVTGTLLTFGVVNLEGEMDAIVETIMKIVTAVSGVVALIGRLVAKTEIKKLQTTIIKVFIVAILLLTVAGCGKVWMSADYSQQTEMAAIVVEEYNERCQTESNDCTPCREGLQRASETLNLIVDGLHGIESEASNER